MNKELIVEAINEKETLLDALKAEVKELKAQLKNTDVEANKNLVTEGATLVCKFGKTEEITGKVISVREKTFTLQLESGKKISRNFCSVIRIVEVK